MSARAVLQYFTALSTGRIVLWCYLIWYLVTVAYYFDPTPSLWLNALGISAVIGTGLVLCVNPGGFGRLYPWPTFRLFLMPFCVSSFSSLIKGHGFFVILPPRMTELMTSTGLCAALVLWIIVLKRVRRPASGLVKQG
ncbi:MAG: hypothetical protein ACT4QA_15115 [Panacagrimonas sp.]